MSERPYDQEDTGDPGPHDPEDEPIPAIVVPDDDDPFVEDPPPDRGEAKDPLP